MISTAPAQACRSRNIILAKPNRSSFRNNKETGPWFGSFIVCFVFSTTVTQQVDFIDKRFTPVFRNRHKAPEFNLLQREEKIMLW